MNIVYMCSSTSIRGMGNIDIFTPVIELISRGHNFHLILRTDGEPYQIEGGKGSAKVYPIIPSFPMAYLSLPFTLWKLHRLLRNIKPDLLIASGNLNMSFTAFIISKMNKLPLIIVFRQTFWESVHHDPTNSWLVRFLSGIPLELSHFIFKMTKNLVAISPGIHSFYTSILKRGNIHLINLMCVDLEQYGLDEEQRKGYRKRFGIQDDEKVILYSGALESARCPDLLSMITAISQLRNLAYDVKLVISGRGECKSELMQKAKERDLSNSIIFVPWLSKEEIPKLISAADICIEPYNRPWPMCFDPSGKLLEYMACGKAVVATNVYGHAEMVRDGINGVLYPANDGAELTNKLRQLLEDHEFAESIGRNARVTVEMNYDVKKAAPILEQFCQKVISEHKKREAACNE